MDEPANCRRASLTKAGRPKRRQIRASTTPRPDLQILCDRNSEKLRCLKIKHQIWPLSTNFTDLVLISFSESGNRIVRQQPFYFRLAANLVEQYPHPSAQSRPFLIGQAALSLNLVPLHGD